ncbi:MAG: hypothetical protein P9L99_07480 [Candidatus Lernaella stagnicola]|nr:hypothetical protein [Candidatus Lernaella stagnicola]
MVIDGSAISANPALRAMQSRTAIARYKAQIYLREDTVEQTDSVDLSEEARLRFAATSNQSELGDNEAADST